MRKKLTICPLLLLAFCLPSRAQQPWTWEKVRERFEANNPTLLAGKLSVDEARADAITANLRPNPQLSVVLDEFTVFNPSVLSVNNAQWTPTVTQLLERQGKRHLRYQSAELAAQSTQTDTQDLERSLLFNLRDAFIRLLAAKSVLQLSTDNLAYYDKVIHVNRDRLQVGDISKIDFERVELQRVQFESDYQNAQVSLRQAKLDLLALINDKSSVDQFDVAGEFDFHDSVPSGRNSKGGAFDPSGPAIREHCGAKGASRSQAGLGQWIPPILPLVWSISARAPTTPWELTSPSRYAFLTATRARSNAPRLKWTGRYVYAKR